MDSTDFKIVELKGDLFSVEDKVALAHCVSADMSMGKGIAVLFRDKFKNIDYLKKQNQKSGGCAYLVDKNSRYVFYLVTKERYFHRPTYDTLRSSLTKMREIMEANGVNQLAMPRIGSGLDGLEWRRVREIIEDVFRLSSVYIRVYQL